MSLRQAAASGVRWTTASTVATVAIRSGSVIVLGRLIGPDAFGLMAAAMVVVGFAQIVANLGLVPAVVQRRNPTTSELSSVYWLSVMLGFSLFAIVWLVRPLAISIFDAEELARLLPVVGLSLVIEPWGSQIRGLLQKSLSFRPLAIIQVASGAGGSMISIVLAMQGLGVWSLAFGSVATAVMQASLLVGVGSYHSLLPHFSFSWRSLQPYVSFGGYVTGSDSLNYFNSNIDQVLIGSVLGTEALGYYSMAYRLVLQPIIRINPILTQVGFPVLVRVKDDERRLRRGYFTMLRILTSINAPILFGLAAIAAVLVPVALGESWSPLVPLLQVLSIMALIRSTGNAGGSLVLATGQASLAFYWNLGLFMVIPLVVTLSAFAGGLMAVAWALLLMQLVLLAAWYLVVVRRLLGPCFAGYAESMGWPTLLAAIMAILVAIVVQLSSSMPELSRLVLAVFVGSVTYLGLYWLFLKDSGSELIRLFLGRQT